MPARERGVATGKDRKTLSLRSATIVYRLLGDSPLRSPLMDGGRQALKTYDEKTGRFRFLSLKQRLDRINVRQATYRRLLDGGDQDDPSWTHFREELDRWSDLDLSRTYRRFASQARPLSINLPVLYVNREKVLALLLNTVKGSDGKSTPALCDLIVALARDLGAPEFMPHFSAVVTTFHELISSMQKEMGSSVFWESAAQVEPLFVALGRLAKLFIRQMLTNIEDTMRALEPFLNSPRAKLRQLCAQSVSGYMLRKCREEEELGATLAEVLGTKAAAPSLFEAMRGAQSKLKFDANRILSKALDLSRASASRFQAVCGALHQLYQSNVDPQGMRTVGEALLEAVERASKDGNDEELARHIFLLRKWRLLTQLGTAEQPTERLVVEILETLIQLLGRHGTERGETYRVMQRSVSDGTVSWALGYYFSVATVQSSGVDAAIQLGVACLEIRERADDSAMSDGDSGGQTNADGPTAGARSSLSLLSALAEKAFQTVNHRAAGDRTILVPGQSEHISRLVSAGLEADSRLERADALEIASLIKLAPEDTRGPIVAIALQDDDADLAGRALRAIARQGLDDDRRFSERAWELLKANSRSHCLLTALHELKSPPLASAGDLREFLLPSFCAGDSSTRMLSINLYGRACSAALEPIVNLCREIERAPLDVQSVDNTRHLVLTLQVRASRDIPSEELPVLAAYAIGLLTKKSATLWPAASGLWAACLRGDRSAVSGLLMEALSATRGAALVYSGRGGGGGDDGVGGDAVEGEGIVRRDEQEGEPRGRKRKRAAGQVDPRGKNLQKRRGDPDAHAWEDAEWTSKRDTMRALIHRRAEVRTDESDAVDPLTNHLQLVRTLRENAGSLHHMAAWFLTEMFLPTAASGDRMSRSLADRLLCAHVQVVEAYGGLRVCRAHRDKYPDLEERTRTAILSVMRRPSADAQKFAVRALLASGSQVAGHRERLLGLCSDSGFRENLALIAASFGEEPAQDPGAPAAPTGEQEELMQVVLRIVFGKISQRKDGQKNRRRNTLRFLAESVSDAHVQSFIAFALEPIADEVEAFRVALGDRNLAGMGDIRTDVAPGVLVGILHMITDVIQELGEKLSSGPWETLLCTSSLIFTAAHSAGSSETDLGAQAKDLRSLSTRALADTFFRRPELGTNVCRYLLDKSADNIDRIESSGEGMPALLYLISSLIADKENLRESVLENKRIIRRLVGLLKDPQASSSALSAVLDVWLALFEDHDAGRHEDLYGDITDGLLSALSRIVAALGNARKEAQLNASVTEKTIALVAELSKRLTDPEHVLSLAEAVVSLVAQLGKKERLSRTEEETFCHTLRSLETLMLKMRAHDTGVLGRCVRSLAVPFSRPWLDKSESEARGLLIRALAASGSEDVAKTAALLGRMNAFSTSAVSEPDYGERLEAYSELARALDGAPGAADVVLDGVTLREDALLPVIHQGVAASTSPDGSIRGSAGMLLTSIVALYCRRQQGEGPHLAVTELVSVLRERVLKSRTTQRRREPLRALGEVARSPLVQALREAPPDQKKALHASLRFAADVAVLARLDDLEADFFEGASHIQRHRRARALGRASKAVEAGDAPANLGVKFLLPLALSMAHEPDESRKRLKNGQLKQTDTDLVDACAGLASAVAQQVGWTSYRAVVTRLLKALHSKDDKDTGTAVSLKVLVAVLQAFHFDTAETPAEAADGDVSDRAEGPRGEALPAREGEDPDAPAPLSSVGTYLTSTLIPTLLSEMIVEARGGGVEQLNSALASAAAQLLSKLPRNEIEPRLPNLTTPLCAALASRLNDVRDSARRALSDTVVFLGSRYLHYLIAEMRATLTEGFRRHVLTYSTNYVLHQMEKRVTSPFLVDAAVVQSIFEIFFDELQGSIAEEKDRDAPTAAFKESKGTAAFDALEVTAAGLDFNRCANTLFALFREKLENCTSLKLLGRLEELLRRVAKGLQRNSSMAPEDALRFVHAILEELLPQCSDSSAPPAQGDAPPAGKSPPMARNAHVLAKFAVMLLRGVLPTATSEEVLPMLEPLLKVLPGALRTSYDGLTDVALRTIQRMMKMPLNCRAEVAESVLSAAVRILSRSSVRTSKAAEDLFCSALRTTSTVLQEVPKREQDNKDFLHKRVRGLLSVAKSLYTEGSVNMQIASITFLRAVIRRRMELPEVYDAADEIAATAIRSQSEPLRNVACSLVMSFLINYPMSKQRLRQHLEFFVRNLDYEHANGRINALQAVQGAVEKFPDEVVEREAEFLFVSLASSLADPDAGCRSAARGALMSLLRRCGSLPRTALAIGDIIVAWTSSTTEALQRTGGVATAVAAEAGALPASQLEGLLGRLGARGEHLADDDWMELYELVHAVEKVVGSERGQPLLRSDAMAGILERMCDRDGTDGWMLHDHGWIRLACSRVLGLYFASVGPPKAAAGRPEGTIFSTAHQGRVRGLLKALCAHLEARELTVTIAEQATKNLFYLASAMSQSPSMGDVRGLPGDDDGQDVGAGFRVSPRPESDNRGLRWLVSRLCSMGSRAGAGSSLRRASALKLVGSLLDQLHLEGEVDLRPVLVSATYFSLEARPVPEGGFPGDNADAVLALPEIADNLRADLIERIGAAEFYSMYREAQKRRDTARLDRRRQHASLVASNPDVAMRRRMKRNKVKRAKRKEEVRKRMLRKGGRKFSKAPTDPFAADNQHQPEAGQEGTGAAASNA